MNSMRSPITVRRGILPGNLDGVAWLDCVDFACAEPAREQRKNTYTGSNIQDNWRLSDSPLKRVLYPSVRILSATIAHDTTMLYTASSPRLAKVPAGSLRGSVRIAPEVARVVIRRNPSQRNLRSHTASRSNSRARIPLSIRSAP